MLFLIFFNHNMREREITQMQKLLKSIDGVENWQLSSIVSYWLDCNVALRQQLWRIRNGIYAIARPAVCLMGWISQKRLKLGSCNFHHRVSQSL